MLDKVVIKRCVLYEPLDMADLKCFGSFSVLEGSIKKLIDLPRPFQYMQIYSRKRPNTCDAICNFSLNSWQTRNRITRIPRRILSKALVND